MNEKSANAKRNHIASMTRDAVARERRPIAAAVVALAQPPEEPERREARPREERVAELPDVEAEARVVAFVRVVHVAEGAVEHVVEDEPIGERRAVPHVHRDVPGHRDARG